MRRSLICFVLASVVVVAGFAMAPAYAMVNLNVACSAAALKRAITTANGSGGGTLTLASGCTYVLTTVDDTGANGPNGLPVVSSPITVVGNGATIARSDAGGTPPFRLLEIAASGSLNASRLTMSGGMIPKGFGGGMFISAGAGVILNAVTMTKNSTPTPDNLPDSLGGAIYNAGTLSIESSTFADNGVTSDGGGGAVENNNGHVDVRTSVFRHNVAAVGGALHSGGANGSIVVRDSTFADNSGGDAGGAIENDQLNRLEVYGSSFQSNSGGRGGGVFNGGTAVLLGDDLVKNSGAFGGGFYNIGTATLTGVRLDGNLGAQGGGVHNERTLTIDGATMNGNTAFAGGGFQQIEGATATISNSSLTSNEAILSGGGTLGIGGGAENRGSLSLVGTRVTSNRAATIGGGVFNAGQLFLSGGSAILANTPNNCVNSGSGAGC
jgi:hypothetical protein